MINKAILFFIHEQKISQYKLAQIIGVGRPTIKKACANGSNPTFKTLIKIAGGLGVTVGQMADKAHEIKKLSKSELSDFNKMIGE